MQKTQNIAIVGVGKIARDQHIPSISQSASFELAATASRNARIGGIDGFDDLESLLQARPNISCISLCTPPQVRYEDARRALLAGRHVMLEKPPGATLSEVHDLIDLAKSQNVSLFATWHSRHAVCVAKLRAWMADKKIKKIDVNWREDVRRWHPGQEWIWEAGGLGVFDPGINALSILTEIYQHPLHLAKADLKFPANRDTPIAAELTFADFTGTKIWAGFDWLEEGQPCWEIDVVTDQGSAHLSEGGARLSIDGTQVKSGSDQEYSRLYTRFAEVVAEGAIDVDLAPMTHVADAFTLGRRQTVEAFDW